MSRSFIVEILFLVPIIGFAAFGCGRDREADRLAECQSNQRQILDVLLIYADRHRGKLPSDLTLLVKYGYLMPETLVCPEARGKNVGPYVLFPVTDLNGPDAAVTPVICCRAHPGKTVVGYADGHVSVIAGSLP